MNKIGYSALGLCLLASTSFASPYIGIKIGFGSVSGAKSTIDTGIKQVALGYTFDTAPLYVIGEVGVTDGMSYDAGHLGEYVDNHVQVHIGSSINGLVGVGWKATPHIHVAVLGGMQSTKIATTVMSSQDTLSKVQPLVSVRLSYAMTKYVSFGVAIDHNFGKSGAVYTFNPMNDVATLNHVPSVTTVMVGATFSL